MADGPGWWVAPVFALAGVVVGVVGKWFSDLLMERSRREREDHLRFVADKRDAYAKLLAAGRRVRIHHARARANGGDADVKARSKARMEAGEAFAVISIIGSRQIVESARWYFNLLVKNDASDDEVNRALNTFRVAARVDLGAEPLRVVVRPLPGWRWWRMWKRRRRRRRDPLDPARPIRPPVRLTRPTNVTEDQPRSE
jgi:hypothetical protein